MHLRILSRRPSSRPLTRQDIRKTSRATIAALAVYGVDSCLFGSAACSMYGVRRIPNDIDVIVLTDQYKKERMKEILVAIDPKFLLARSQKRGANYNLLFYELPRQGFCKVDILIPGIMSIPYIPTLRFVFTRVPGVPVMPLIPLLMLKLQGWTDHRDSRRLDFQAKQHVDVEDIHELLGILSLPFYRSQKVATESWLPESMIYAAQSRVYEFTDEFPGTKRQWQDIGFDVDFSITL